MIISPSLLAADFLNLKSEFELLQPIENLWIHLDIMDGHFVPNLTFGTPIIQHLKNVCHHPLDAHFMVTNPVLYLDLAKTWGLHNFTFHFEAITHHHDFILAAKKIFPSVGISLNPCTKLESVPLSIFGMVDLVLIMSVNPGFGGQGFIPESIDKVISLEAIRHKNSFNFVIQVDGGVNEKNAPYLFQAGATNLVAGSYIFSEPQKKYKKRIDSLR